jgi:gamma-glutamylaminecyclotransferase
MTTRVFVYGSLMKGFTNHRLLMSARFVGTAKTRAQFTMLDMRAFPGIVPGHGEVTGELYDVTPDELARLDQLEGHPNFYRRTPIVLADGTEASTYVLRKTFFGAPVIASGDWRRHRSAA